MKTYHDMIELKKEAEEGKEHIKRRKRKGLKEIRKA